MTGKSLLETILDAGSSGALAALYGPDLEAARRRYAALAEGMLRFADQPARGALGFSRDAPVRDFPETQGELRVFSAPGRTELGGNHTDHNRGKILAASIQLDQAAVAAPRDDGIVVFRSTGYPDAVVDLGSPDNPQLAPESAETGTTEALIRGIAAEFERRGTPVRGFTANADSAVLPGSGLSSSAAVEVLIGRIFDNLYGGGQCSALEIAQIGQRAENRYFGKPSGLMDQIACASGGAVAVDFEDAEKPRITRINFDPSLAGYTLCVVDTHGSHAHLVEDYAAIPEEMKGVARFFGKTVLRELDWDTVIARSGEIRQALGDRALLRAMHFFHENRRVEAMRKFLEQADKAIDPRERQGTLSRYLAQVNESGDSSWELLQNIYSPKQAKEQGIALALILTRNFIAGQGASRVHGGGFAGTIQAYIPTRIFGPYRATLDAVFGQGSVTALRVRPQGAVELRF